MSKGQRILFFLLAVAALLVIFGFLYGKATFASGITVLIFSSLLMLVLVTLFLEHFFTTPSDVVASTMSILLLLSPMRAQLSCMGVWFVIFYAFNVLLFCAAFLALLLLDGTASAGTRRNKLSSALKWLAATFGNGRILFGTLFFLALVFYVDSQSKHFLILSAYAGIVALIDPKKQLGTWLRSSKHTHSDIGQIIGVQSKNTFLARLFSERLPVRRFDLVEFRYSMDEDRRVFKGMIIDEYLMNEQHWIKILTTEDLGKALGHDAESPSIESNVVYKIRSGKPPEFLDRFVGVVVQGSTIEKLRFEYSTKVPITEGDLLEASVGSVRILYQVVQGRTEVETLEFKNETGFIVGEAAQLGQWNGHRYTFDKYGWVPEINTPVFLTTEIDPVTVPKGEFRIGIVPNTNFPIFLNLTDAITTHLAILGTTGSGKSVFARNLIRRLVAEGVKIFCVDFTNEYKSKLSDLKLASVIPKEKEEKLFESIDVLSAELDKFANQRIKAVISEKEKYLRDEFSSGIREFLKSDAQIALFELPDVSNTTGILEYTKWFFRTLFQIARSESIHGKQVCIVLEEAHTVIPEWNFIGVDERKGQSLVNSIGQIALQGRKYKVGFMIIAQRTANVSKTVLTQCNTIIAFQQFDKTSSDFLSNYMGSAMAEVLPRLKFRQAIAVGKGLRSGVPVILEVPEISEPKSKSEGGQEEAQERQREAPEKVPEN